MVVLIWIPLLLLFALASSLRTQYIFENPRMPVADLRIPTQYESAVQARRVLKLQSIATLSTVFPPTAIETEENRPKDVVGSPIGLLDYYASCGPQSYNPTILAISIATSFKNAKAGSNVTLSLRHHPPATRPPSDDPYTYSPANMPRFSLIGHIEKLSHKEVKLYDVQSCFLKEHADAGPWTPGNVIHESWWAKLVVEEVYWIGGFGDRAYIGWIPLNDWQRVTPKEIEKARLVGEEGYILQPENMEL